MLVCICQIRWGATSRLSHDSPCHAHTLTFFSGIEGYISDLQRSGTVGSQLESPKNPDSLIKTEGLLGVDSEDGHTNHLFKQDHPNAVCEDQLEIFFRRKSRVSFFSRVHLGSSESQIRKCFF